MAENVERKVREFWGPRSLEEEVKRLREARWLVVKAMLDDYPKLRERVKRYLAEGGG